MVRQAKTTALSLTAAALVLGRAAPAFADVPPRREHTKRTVEPHHAPPMTPPPVETPPPEVEASQPETAPPSQPTPEEAKAEAKAATDAKSGSCSIDADSDQTIAGFAALLMLITGAALLGRRG
jgi:hypothetical protein